MTRHLHPIRFPTDSDPGTVAGFVTMLTLGAAFTLAALEVSWFWVVFPVGFGGVMPVAVGAAKRRRRGGSRDARSGRGTRERAAGDVEEDAALARLRERYAAGELDEVAFEARLERLLLTEDTDAARDHAASRVRAREEAESPAESDTPDHVNAD